MNEGSEKAVGRRFLNQIFLLLLLMSLLGCTDLSATSKFQPKKISFSSYADDIGFSLDEPTKRSFDVETSFQISGEVKKHSKMDFPHLWIVAEHKDKQKDPFNYYITLDDGQFSETITLPFGAGDYEISVRAPNDEHTYYDVAIFSVNNLDEHEEQVPEYTRFGVENELQMTQVEAGDGALLLTGSVAKTYNHDKVLIEVRKDSEVEQIVWLVNDFVFTGEVPLYFGEGMHEVHIQLHNEADDYYYTSGIVRIQNEVDKQFATVETYTDYFTSGVVLEKPSWTDPNILSEQAYKVKGKIDPSINVTDPVEHIIVTMTYLDEDLESGHIIPVENNVFEDDVYFRFGPGTYEVKINVPDYEKTDQSMFYYRTIAKTTYDVIDVPDERDLLPSRGIESEHPTIIAKAEEITAGLVTEREKAKAIYEFVAKNVSYDVKKAESDLFSVSDSALTTLQAGSGICQDYAFLATALLRAIGLEAHYVSGHAGERHAWVEVKVDGEWIEMDPTWGAGYVYEGQFYFQYNEQYFDPDPHTFQETHTREQIMY